uniref:Bidirectional sugar transporter SWEET n=1 Tax=Aegilops tauschii TaxID=37682 RepID=N1R345_AEGTA
MACYYVIGKTVWYTFVNPILKEGSIGDRMVYAHLFAFFNSVMWSLYASTDLPNKLLLFIISGMGIIAHFFYINFYIKFAKGKKRMEALVLLFTVSMVSVIMIVIVLSMVLTHRWSSTFVNVIASTSGASTHIVPIYDLVMVIMSKKINNMNPMIMALVSLFSASSWTAYGFISVPMNLYIVVPNFMGILSATMQIVVYSYLIYNMTCIHSVQTDDVIDYSYEMGKLFVSSPPPV